MTAKTWLLGDDKENRNAFQNAMQDKFIQAIENLSGRQVLAFIEITTSNRTSRSSCFSSRPIPRIRASGLGSTEVSVVASTGKQRSTSSTASRRNCSGSGARLRGMRTASFPLGPPEPRTQMSQKTEGTPRGIEHFDFMSERVLPASRREP